MGGGGGGGDVVSSYRRRFVCGEQRIITLPETFEEDSRASCLEVI